MASVYCTFTALLRKSLIINGAGEGNRTPVSGFFGTDSNGGFVLGLETCERSQNSISYPAKAHPAREILNANPGETGRVKVEAMGERGARP
jgi:hypothetical protein